MASNNRRRQKAAAKEAVEEVSFFEKHLRLIAYIAAAVVLVVLAIVLARIFINRRGAKAELALYPCEQYFLQGNYERALGGDGQQCDGFLTVASQYSMTKAGNLAKLYAGLSYAKMGQYDEARQYLEKFSPRKDEMISPAALGALGNTYVQLGEQEKGAETL
ncbi:MAG: hypothetical protein LUC33_03605, partial [Prevotellaceae bacterium]|nr:hypothetical protein [Prevotellaceae bacterium]